MSSTHSISKHVGAVRDVRSGTTNYVLMEETFESNVFPRTPRPSVWYFGDYDSCMTRIIRSAGSCEGGSLKHRGWVRPEAYIRAWRAAFEVPVELTSTAASARLGRSMYDIDEKAGDAVAGVLRRHGLAVSDVKIALDLATDAAVVQELQALEGEHWYDKPCPAWRLIQSYQLNKHAPAPWAAVRVAKTSGRGLLNAAVHRMPWGRFGEANHVLTIDGDSRITGWAYSTVAAFAPAIAAAEKVRPGCAESLYGEARKLVEASAPLPDGTVIEIRRPGLTDQWAVECFRDLIHALGGHEDDELTARPLSAFEAQDMSDKLCSMDARLVRVRIPDGEPAFALCG